MNGVTVVGGAELNIAAGLVVLVVVLTLVQGIEGELEVGSIRVGHRGSEGASNGGESDDQVGEGDHVGRECRMNVQ